MDSSFIILSSSFFVLGHIYLIADRYIFDQLCKLGQCIENDANLQSRQLTNLNTACTCHFALLFVVTTRLTR